MKRKAIVTGFLIVGTILAWVGRPADALVFPGVMPHPPVGFPHTESKIQKFLEKLLPPRPWEVPAPKPVPLEKYNPDDYIFL